MHSQLENVLPDLGAARSAEESAFKNQDSWLDPVSEQVDSGENQILLTLTAQYCQIFFRGPILLISLRVHFPVVLSDYHVIKALPVSAGKTEEANHHAAWRYVIVRAVSI